MQISACLCSFLPTANSSSEIKVLSTEHGIVLHSTVTYYHEDLRVGWLHKYVKLSWFAIFYFILRLIHL